MRATGRYLAVVLLLTILTPSLIAQDQPVTLFSSTATPASMNVSAGRPLDLGMKFKSDTAGYIAGVRFYKGASNVGTHIGSLWTGTGDLLAQATFAGETASGWQQVNFAAPVAIAANVRVRWSLTTAAVSTASLPDFSIRRWPMRRCAR